ncbi:MAG: hypothetical protein PHF11_01610 [Candidatus Omnitrophica bacterium]|nr:hypothetical protein [Candidatus Omnitrophota bacterium]
MTNFNFKSGSGPFIRSVLLFCLIINLVGCEAFVRKFTRKSKKEKTPVEEMVITPQEYKPPVMSKEERYREYFLYWKSWHDELIESLSWRANPKKQLSCANEAIKNLEQVRALLNAARQRKLDTWLNKLRNLRDAVKSDTYGTDISRNKASAERIRLNIMQHFSYPKIKDDLV